MRRNKAVAPVAVSRRPGSELRAGKTKRRQRRRAARYWGRARGIGADGHGPFKEAVRRTASKSCRPGPDLEDLKAMAARGVADRTFKENPIVHSKLTPPLTRKRERTPPHTLGAGKQTSTPKTSKETSPTKTPNNKHTNQPNVHHLSPDPHKRNPTNPQPTQNKTTNTPIIT